ncbi:MAG TPA: hypothetical protein DD429_08485 [Clostridiaceae bacterium]|nr:hypothetical protein [Clostridiaceae bacterium]
MERWLQDVFFKYCGIGENKKLIRIKKPSRLFYFAMLQTECSKSTSLFNRVLYFLIIKPPAKIDGQMI